MPRASDFAYVERAEGETEGCEADGARRVPQDRGLQGDSLAASLGKELEPGFEP